MAAIRPYLPDLVPSGLPMAALLEAANATSVWSSGFHRAYDISSSAETIADATGKIPFGTLNPAASDELRDVSTFTSARFYNDLGLDANKTKVKRDQVIFGLSFTFVDTDAGWTPEMQANFLLGGYFQFYSNKRRISDNIRGRHVPLVRDLYIKDPANAGTAAYLQPPSARMDDVLWLPKPMLIPGDRDFVAFYSGYDISAGLGALAILNAAMADGEYLHCALNFHGLSLPPGALYSLVPGLDRQV